MRQASTKKEWILMRKVDPKSPKYNMQYMRGILLDFALDMYAYQIIDNNMKLKHLFDFIDTWISNRFYAKVD